MIVGTGIDIVEVPRLRKAIETWGESFLSKIFTPRETAYARSRRFSYQHLAGRFAAKEACMKALGIPKKWPLQWTQIEVMNDENGKPVVKFYDDALRLMKKLGVDEVVVSLSHSKNYAVANAILFRSGKR
jgi:holo-[acyl-carrier protein] synthase